MSSWVGGWIVGDADDPLHQAGQVPAEWTTVNLAEAFPGVPTPLTYSVIAAAFECALRRAFHRIGTFSRDEVPIPADPSKRLIGIQFGRVAANMDMFHTIANRMPGTTPAEYDKQYFGTADGAPPSEPELRRYLTLAGKLPVAAPRARRALLANHRVSPSWWRESLDAPVGSLSDAIGLMQAAQQRIVAIFVPHTIISMLALGFYTPVRALAESIGKPGLESAAMRAGTTDESRVVADLWAVSRGTTTIERFVEVHGYHGPDEGDLSSCSWREDPGPVLALVETYRRMGEESSPMAAEARHRTRSESAIAELLAGLPAPKRLIYQRLLATARNWVPLREFGRDDFLKAIDIARFAARAVGGHLHDAGRLADPDDVFHLVAEELGSDADLSALVASRLKRSEEYRRLQLPDRWRGVPTPVAAGTDEPPGTVLDGRGVSGGTVEGEVRVITEQGSESLLPGEILVCHTTDPSWAPYFHVAAGVVTDIGGPLSHGAIVARELGIPCVANATRATRLLRTGDRISIDGGTGRIEVLQRRST